MPFSQVSYVEDEPIYLGQPTPILIDWNLGQRWSSLPPNSQRLRNVRSDFDVLCPSMAPSSPPNWTPPNWDMILYIGSGDFMPKSCKMDQNCCA
ncbi:unnamed protein product [Prunus armeniaca]